MISFLSTLGHAIPASNFHALLARYFDGWDHDQNGQLNKAEFRDFVRRVLVSLAATAVSLPQHAAAAFFLDSS